MDIFSTVVIIIFLTILLNSIIYGPEKILSRISRIKNSVTSWKSLKKVGDVVIVSTREIGEECELCEIVIHLVNNSNRQITFKTPNVQAFDKKGFILDEWTGSHFERVVPRNSKDSVDIRFRTNGRIIDKIRIWDHDIQITPDIHIYDNCY